MFCASQGQCIKRCTGISVLHMRLFLSFNQDTSLAFLCSIPLLLVFNFEFPVDRQGCSLNGAWREPSRANGEVPTSLSSFSLHLVNGRAGWLDFT